LINGISARNELHGDARDVSEVENVSDIT